MKTLNKHQILGAQDRELKRVDVPQWGGPVYLRSLSLGDAMTFDRERDKDPKPNDTVLLLVLTLSDEDGKPLYELSDMEVLATRDSKVLGRLFNLSLDLCGLGGGDDQAKGSEVVARGESDGSGVVAQSP